MADLLIDTRRDGEVGFVTLAGEARLELCESMRAKGGALLKAGAKHLLVDVHALSFVDSASMGVLLEMRRHAVASGGSMTFVRANARFRRRLDDMGLGAQFAHAGSEADALSGIAHGGAKPPASGPALSPPPDRPPGPPAAPRPPASPA